MSIILIASFLFDMRDLLATSKSSNFGALDCIIQSEFADGKLDSTGLSIYKIEYWDTHANVADRAMQSCIVAELKKHAGQYDAVIFYRYTISQNDTEPAYNIIFGNYYQNYRGPRQPLFDQAINEYESACQKLGTTDCQNVLRKEKKEAFSAQERELDRSLTRLYERDGIPLFLFGIKKRPAILFSTQAVYKNVTSASDENDDIREFTSEAMLVESRTNKPARVISINERMDILRNKEVTESFSRFRARPYQWPVIELFFRYKQVKNAQITDFDVRNDATQLRQLEFNPLTTNEYGLSLEKLISTELLGDFSAKALYSKIYRKGLIEKLPDARENVNNLEVTLVGSRFFARRKIDVEMSYVNHHISQEISSPQKRARSIAAINAEYHLGSSLKSKNKQRNAVANFDHKFSSRGTSFFGGVVTDRERFGPDKVVNENYFVGGSWKGIRPTPRLNVFDIRVQATIFTADVQEENTGSNRYNSQLRIGAIVSYRKIDEETNSWPPKYSTLGIPFSSLQYIASISNDTARSGPNYYENWSLGLKVVGKGHSRFLDATILGALGIDYKRFTKLQTNKAMVIANIGIGF